VISMYILRAPIPPTKNCGFMRERGGGTSLVRECGTLRPLRSLNLLKHLPTWRRINS